MYISGIYGLPDFISFDLSNAVIPGNAIGCISFYGLPSADDYRELSNTN